MEHVPRPLTLLLWNRAPTDSPLPPGEQSDWTASGVAPMKPLRLRNGHEVRQAAKGSSSARTILQTCWPQHAERACARAGPRGDALGLASRAGGSDAQSETHLSHLLLTERTNEAPETRLVHALHVIELDRRRMLETLFHADLNFGG